MANWVLLNPKKNNPDPSTLRYVKKNSPSHALNVKYQHQPQKQRYCTLHLTSTMSNPVSDDDNDAGFDMVEDDIDDDMADLFSFGAPPTPVGGRK